MRWKHQSPRLQLEKRETLPRRPLQSQTTKDRQTGILFAVGKPLLFASPVHLLFCNERFCRRRSQTPRLLCSACSPRIVTPWATLGSVRSIHTTCRVPHKASNAQWNVHSSQASKDARSQSTANTNAANQQVPKRRVFTTNKAKWYNDNIPINATHSHLPITLQLALI